jgi:GntP family gluconate:H+ symporter
MCVGVAVVLLLMIRMKFHAFVALILGAIAISCFIPLNVTGFNRSVKGPAAKPHVVLSDSAEPVQVISRVTSSLGNSVAGIGVLIAMASIIGKCMLVSGAADRIVQAALKALGEKRAATALMISSFILGIPVFFDTVFYLLVPLARSLHRQTGKDYMLYLGAIAVGGAVTHTLVPPTPGPLLVAETLQVDIGPVILIGLVVGFPASIIGLLVAQWINRRMPTPMRPMPSAAAQAEVTLARLPGLVVSLVPVLLPVVLISVATIFKTLLGSDPGPFQKSILGWFELAGNANLAMTLAALFSIYLCWRYQGHTLRELSDHAEDALLSGGVIILITAAGGAFGNLLAMTEIQSVVESLFANSSQQYGGLVLLTMGFVIAAILKVAQGSSTVAMIISSSLIGPIALQLAAQGQLGFHVAYLVPVLGGGSMVGSWMNDSGFWVYAKMGVVTEQETLRSWTILLCVIGTSAFLFAATLAMLLPMV